VLRPNMACAIRPPSSLPIGNKFREVTTIPTQVSSTRILHPQIRGSTVSTN
jgi:hypothetical protein